MQDPLVTCHSYAAHALWHLGYPDQARKRINEALTLAQELSSPYSLVFALINTGAIHHYLREPHAVQKWAEAVLALSAEHEFPYTLAQGKILRGWALAAQNQGEEGIVQAEEGLVAFQAIGAVLWRVSALTHLAEAHENIRQPSQGLGRLDEAMVQVGQTEERWWEAEIYRLKGELLLSLSPDHSAEAETCFHQALDIAQRQQAKSLELRAAMSRKHAAACQVLAEVYGWCTEGFDTADLHEARALLDELAESRS